MGLFDNILGSDDPDTLLEEKHDTTPSNLFTEDRTGETKYNKEIVIDQEIKENIAQWRDQDNIERLSSRFQDNIQIAGNRMDIDWDGTEQLYQEVVGQDECVEYLSEDQAVQMTAQSAYEASAALEKAVRESLHSDMDQIVYQTDVEGEEGTETTRTPVSATVPEAMHGFTEQLDQEAVPEGWSIGHATAVADRYHIMSDLKRRLEHESGTTPEAQIERMEQDGEVESPLEVGAEDEYVQDKLKEYGFPEDEVRAEYHFGQ
jgi:hypothetical protein